MDKQLIEKLFNKHLESENIPLNSSICEVSLAFLEVLFPALSEHRFRTLSEFEGYLEKLRNDLVVILNYMDRQLADKPENIAAAFIQKLSPVYELLQKDIEAINMGDPAARSEYEVVKTYPGFFAIAMYRLAHALDELDVPLLPRFITEHAHMKTGIDIHPSAEIGPYFCIDHGTGVVIGETTVIGPQVKLYQGVTLGALSVEKKMAKMKRHPTIEENVVIYAGATILGGETVIGKNSIIGGNAWLTKSIPANSTVYHQEKVKVNNWVDENMQ